MYKNDEYFTLARMPTRIPCGCYIQSACNLVENGRQVLTMKAEITQWRGAQE